MRHFLIDASALVPFFVKPSSRDVPARSAIVKLLALRAEKRAMLYVPNFCMAECSKAFADLAFKATSDHARAADAYNKNVETLLETVSSSRKGLIRSYALKRERLVDIEDIFKAEYAYYGRREHSNLSGWDALVLAMTRDLAKAHGKDSVLVVTKDEVMAKVCNHSRHLLPQGIYVLEDAIPG